jgi:hypothetical protein
LYMHNSFQCRKIIGKEYNGFEEVRPAYSTAFKLQNDLQSLIPFVKFSIKN